MEASFFLLLFLSSLMFLLSGAPPIVSSTENALVGRQKHHSHGAPQQGLEQVRFASTGTIMAGNGSVARIQSFRAARSNSCYADDTRIRRPSISKCVQNQCMVSRVKLMGQTTPNRCLHNANSIGSLVNAIMEPFSQYTEAAVLTPKCSYRQCLMQKSNDSHTRIHMNIREEAAEKTRLD